MRSDPVGAQFVLGRAASRELDRLATEEFGVPSIVLMENAARALCEAALDLIAQRGLERCLVVAGRGANGGDGFACARHLHNTKIPARVAIIGDPDRIKGDARTNLDIIRKMRIEVVELSRSMAETLGSRDLILDALFGTGLDRPVEGEAGAAIDLINLAKASGAGVLSADLPSGRDADTGEMLGRAVEADLTVSFGAWKPGLLGGNTGEVVIGGIGAPSELIQRLGKPLPEAGG